MTLGVFLSHPTIYDATVQVSIGDPMLLFSENTFSFCQPFTVNDKAMEVQNKLAEQILSISYNGKILVKNVKFTTEFKMIITLGRSWHNYYRFIFVKELIEAFAKVGIEAHFI